MCLLEPEKITVNKPLTVYKVFFVERDGKLSSIYRHCMWQLGKRKSKQSVIEKEKLERSVENMGMIGIGAFHSFKYKKDAQKEMAFIKEYYHGKPVVTKCTIPADSKYVYLGAYGGAYGYASSDLIIDKIY